MTTYQFYPEPNYSPIKCLVASGGQTPRSIKEESVVRLVLARRRGRVYYGWVLIVSRFTRGSSELELTEERGGEEKQGKDGAGPEEEIQSHPGTSFSGQLPNQSKPSFYPSAWTNYCWRGK